MSGKKSRNKGANGEREFFKLVEEHLGVKLRRNLSQYQENGLGDARLADFHIEIKRGKAYQSIWWKQTCSETAPLLQPALCYRLDRKPWRIRVSGPMLCEALASSYEPDRYINEDFAIEMSLEAFFQIVRERM